MRISNTMKLPALLLAFGLLASACSSDEPDTDESTETSTDSGAEGEGSTSAGATLKQVTDRGTLNCGVNGSLAGFSLNENGTYTGFDVDFCRAVAAAVLGDPEAVEYKDLTAETRFTALQSGEVDMLSRNTTWTASRDGSLSLQFVTTTFYDGQGMMVMADSEFETLEDMQNTVVCVQSGTTTELNLATVFEARGITYEPLLLPDEEGLISQFTQGACDAYTTDKSGLASTKTTISSGPDSVRILDVTMSKEPLGPAVRQGDDEWFDIVNWVVLATIQAEEFGLSSDNIANAATEFADNPEILRFVGQGAGDDAQFEAGLNLPQDFAVKVIEAVGNYAEIYERNITPLGLERGLNALWTEGGILYAPPYR